MIYFYDGGDNDFNNPDGWSGFFGAPGGVPGPDDLLLINSGDITFTTGADLGFTLLFGNLTMDNESGGIVNMNTDFLLPGSTMTWEGGGFTAQNVLLTPGATLDAGASSGGAPDTIGELMNVGGSVIDASNLLIGGPGFVQFGVATPGEMNLHTGGDDYINLGNIAQGSSVLDVALGILNGTNQDIPTDVSLFGDVANTMGLPLGNTGFYADVRPVPDTITPGGLTTAVFIGVNTNVLGAHTMIAEGPAGYAVGITDNIVAA